MRQRASWNYFFAKTCHTAGWKNEKGEEQTKPQGLSWETFQLCQNEYLLSVSKKNMAEQIRIHLTFHVKKPTQVLVRVFMQRLDQMNTYLPYLPCLKDSDVTPPETEHMNWPFSQYELGVIVIRACSSAWDEHYYLLR